MFKIRNGDYGSCWSFTLHLGGCIILGGAIYRWKLSFIKADLGSTRMDLRSIRVDPRSVYAAAAAKAELMNGV
jgi:hypothetical protein